LEDELDRFINDNLHIKVACDCEEATLKVRERIEEEQGKLLEKTKHYDSLMGSDLPEEEGGTSLDESTQTNSLLLHQ